MSVFLELTTVLTPAITVLAATYAAVSLDSPFMQMASHVMVRLPELKGIKVRTLLDSADIDECSSPTTNDCEQICTNIPGLYTCACESGHRLSIDGRACSGKSGIPLASVGVTI